MSERSDSLESEKKHSLRALQATNFFLADVQTGLGPFLAAYLAGAGWNPGRVGFALTVGAWLRSCCRRWLARLSIASALAGRSL